MSIIHLVLISNLSVTYNWKLGKSFSCQPKAEAINEIISTNFTDDPSDAWFFWDPDLGQPDVNLLLELLETTADCWHAGLALGLSGEPEIIDFVSPTWMLNRDPDPTIEATSWRLSFRACLVRSEILRQLGGPCADFESLEAAGLELGFRYIRLGAIVRHVPKLVASMQVPKGGEISLRDQLLFVDHGFGRRWTNWAIFRAAWTRFASLRDLMKVWKNVRKLPPSEIHKPFQHKAKDLDPIPPDRVSVLIPTLKRYSYLQVLLNQLRGQSVKAFEIFVIDQTPQQDRDLEMKNQFSDLPARWYFLDQAGQCSSRNFGLQKAQGDYILFLDDDDEIPPDLIERHLADLILFNINISNGVAIESGNGDLPQDFRFLRVSNVFPTNNTMIRECVLQKSGLFDLAYDHGQRADHDLGMRLYLNGELMILNPSIRVLHHHAPVGGLREHKARVDTYAASRTRVYKQVLPSISDLYLIKRYFSPRQLREQIWIDLFGTFSIKGSFCKRLIKGVIAFVSLPRNINQIKIRERKAEHKLEIYPQIPELTRETP